MQYTEICQLKTGPQIFMYLCNLLDLNPEFTDKRPLLHINATTNHLQFKDFLQLRIF